eukprot:gb/GECG01004639.1/.p1 GENE.gb/GECG01004639.1/~~gb/GECG01004639.1/.p1  ORF type:complete len:143 (+),score=23.80 gb/GECG01004639.1/:1-429(+)
MVRKEVACLDIRTYPTTVHNASMHCRLNDTIDELASSQETRSSAITQQLSLERKCMEEEDSRMQNCRAIARIHSLSKDLEEREKELMELLQQCEDMIQRQRSLEDNIESYKWEAQEYREALKKKGGRCPALSKRCRGALEMH